MEQGQHPWSSSRATRTRSRFVLFAFEQRRSPQPPVIQNLLLSTARNFRRKLLRDHTKESVAMISASVVEAQRVRVVVETECDSWRASGAEVEVIHPAALQYTVSPWESRRPPGAGGRSPSWLPWPAWCPSFATRRFGGVASATSSTEATRRGRAPTFAGES